MIIFLGVAGSGKSTQGRLLAEKLNCPWVSTGEILRSSSRGDFKHDLLKGKLVSDDIVLPLLEAELIKNQADKLEIIGDGWPRNINQAKWLDGHIKEGQIKLTAIVHLIMDKDLARERVKLQQRSDGNDAAIDQRFEEYQAAVLPALDYLKSLGYPIIDVDATGDMEQVSAKINRALGAL